MILTVIIENELPLMTPNRLIKELTKTGVGMPVIGLIRSDERKGCDDYEAGHTSYYEPGLGMVTSSDTLTSAKRFHDFKKDVRTTVEHFTGVGFQKLLVFQNR